MNKKYSAFISILFCLFIFGFGIAQFVVPDKEFSEQENRYLAQMPELDFGDPSLGLLKSGNFFNGEFMKGVEDYITDQFPLRDWWINLKANGEKLLGKQENNSVYFGTDGDTLFAQYTRPTAEELAKRIDYINRLAANMGQLNVPTYFALIPDKSFVWADRLPANAPHVDDGSVIEEAGKLVSGNVNWIDLSGAFSGDDVFYRTDHHWSTMGAYQGYAALMTAMNGSVTVLDYEPTLVSDSFFGTTWSSSGASWITPDEMYTWVPEAGIHVTRYPNGAPIPGSLYDLSKLEIKDKYSMYLGGNQPLCVIKNPDASNGKILVIRDSYTDSLAPFLALDYQEVHLFDLRYNRVPITQYVAQNGIDQVLVLYSNSNFATDSNLVMMTR